MGKEKIQTVLGNTGAIGIITGILFFSAWIDRVLSEFGITKEEVRNYQLGKSKKDYFAVKLIRARMKRSLTKREKRLFMKWLKLSVDETLMYSFYIEPMLKKHRAEKPKRKQEQKL